jgi:hypothetical protein
MTQYPNKFNTHDGNVQFNWDTPQKSTEPQEILPEQRFSQGDYDADTPELKWLAKVCWIGAALAVAFFLLIDFLCRDCLRLINIPS